MGAPSEHRVTVTLTGGLRAALAAWAKAHGVSQSAASAIAIAHMLNVDVLGQPLGKVKR
jgi:hypothetical protein